MPVCQELAIPTSIEIRPSTVVKDIADHLEAHPETWGQKLMLDRNEDGVICRCLLNHISIRCSWTMTNYIFALLNPFVEEENIVCFNDAPTTKVGDVVDVLRKAIPVLEAGEADGTITYSETES